MRPIDPPIRLNPLTESLLRQLLRSRTGIVLQSYQLETLEEVVLGACRELGYRFPEEYVRALERADGHSPEMEYLVTRITVGESYFFRDEAQIRFIEQAWLPQVIAQKAAGDRTLRVWSAGCSAGQELYTLAILLMERLPEPRSWSLHLLGTDINTQSLAQAVTGRFTGWSLRATGEAVRTKYFERDGSDWYVVRRDLRELVRFSYLNLLEDSFPSMLTGTASMDLILCRNVFIYFDATLVGPIMEKFKASLVPGGYLLLGASDLAAEARPGLELQQWGDTFCFCRTEGFVGGPLAFTPPPAARADEPAPPAAAGRGPCYPDVVELLRQERWDEVVRRVDDYQARGVGDAQLSQHRAKALANLGLLEDAVRESERSIDLAPLDKHTYLIKALVLLELNQPDKAAEALRKAIFLEPGFVEAHFQLGLLQLRLGERKAGMRSLSNALELAERLDPKRPVHNASGMVFGRLAEILRSEIAVYRSDE